jgi:hypothetical protein
MAERVASAQTRTQHPESTLHSTTSYAARHRTEHRSAHILKHSPPLTCCADIFSSTRISVYQPALKCFGATVAVEGPPKRPHAVTSTDNHDSDIFICFNVTPSESLCSRTNHWLKSGPGCQCCDQSPHGNHVRPEMRARLEYWKRSVTGKDVETRFQKVDRRRAIVALLASVDRQIGRRHMPRFY